MIRMYKYRAFRPRAGTEAFFTAVALKRAMWADLCAMQAELAPRFEAARKPRDEDALSALRRERTARIADIRRSYAARGLAWGDYNAVVFQFDGACRSAAARGALPRPSDAALGESVVRQIMNGCRPHNLLSRNDVSIEYLDPSGPELARRPGSHRSRYRTARMDFQVRTDRNPAGPASLTLDFVLHRPLPLEGRIVEVRIIRTLRPVVRKDGRAGEAERWHVLFAVQLDRPEAAPGSEAVGVVLDWRGDGDGGASELVVARRASIRQLAVGEDHLAAWARSRELFALADAEEDADTKAVRLAEARIFRRRLEAERLNHIRTLAARIAAGAAVVAVEKLRLPPGVKNFTAPSLIRRELALAVEKAGGRLIEVKARRKDFGSTRKLANHLRSEAERAVSDACDDQKKEAA